MLAKSSRGTQFLPPLSCRFTWKHTAVFSNSPAIHLPSLFLIVLASCCIFRHVESHRGAEYCIPWRLKLAYKLSTWVSQSLLWISRNYDTLRPLFSVLVMTFLFMRVPVENLDSGKRRQFEKWAGALIELIVVVKQCAPSGQIRKSSFSEKLHFISCM